MGDTNKVEALIRELDKQREAYLEAFQKVHELLAQNLAATVPKDTLPSSSPPVSPGAENRIQRSNTPHSHGNSERELGIRSRLTGLTLGTSSNSRTTGNDSDNDDEDEALYVQTPLKPRSFDMEAMRSHLRAYKWDKFSREILEGVAGNPSRLSEQPLLPNHKFKLRDRSDLTHYQVFDVGHDGAPLQVDCSHIERESGRAMAIWHAIKDINPPTKQRYAVGRITILREPSPIMFGAIHHTMSDSFNVDELFRNLCEPEMSSASMHRIFDDDERNRRSFVFNFEYFTLIGKDCQPMKWQLAAGQEDRKPDHIAITRCSSVVALVLNGPKIKDIKNPRRRASRDRGEVYDPFSSWQVLNLQCYPDFKASLDVHDPSKHYVNGPEAFMTTLLGELRDARRRFADISERIRRRVRLGPEFIFDYGVRDKLLFEDDEYSMAKRYFWAHQTLGIMNESIKAMIDAYETTFTDEVWEGRHRTLWPLLDEQRSRNKFYRKKMAGLRTEFESIIQRFRRLMVENNDRRKEINGLREDLFTGTSIQESRRSVAAAFTTIEQNRNIKLLTLVNIFFLPLTFVTSVFGMTNMPVDDRHHKFTPFAIVIATVCVPFFVLIGFLNTERGMNIWRRNITSAFVWIARRHNNSKKKDGDKPELLPVKSFDSQALSTSPSFRLRRWSSSQNQRPAVFRGTEIDEPTSREEEQHRKTVEDGPPAVLLSPTGRVVEPTSRIAGMWMEERNQRRKHLKYSEDV